jgi:hypothetical protein
MKNLTHRQFVPPRMYGSKCRFILFLSTSRKKVHDTVSHFGLLLFDYDSQLTIWES